MHLTNTARSSHSCESYRVALLLRLSFVPRLAILWPVEDEGRMPELPPRDTPLKEAFKAIGSLWNDDAFLGDVGVDLGFVRLCNSRPGCNDR